MFVVNSDGSIYITRGDIGSLKVGMKIAEDTNYVFKSGDVVRLNVHERKHPENVVLNKYVEVTSETDIVIITLDRDDTKIGDIVGKPIDYWYEVELNPDTVPQTFLGYDVNGPKIFRLFPEGADE